MTEGAVRDGEQVEPSYYTRLFYHTPWSYYTRLITYTPYVCKL